MRPKHVSLALLAILGAILGIAIFAVLTLSGPIFDIITGRATRTTAHFSGFFLESVDGKYFDTLVVLRPSGDERFPRLFVCMNGSKVVPIQELTEEELSNATNHFPIRHYRGDDGKNYARMDYGLSQFTFVEGKIDTCEICFSKTFSAAPDLNGPFPDRDIEKKAMIQAYGKPERYSAYRFNAP